MIEFMVGWISVIAMVGIICWTIFQGMKLYYRDQKEQRLEHLDLMLQKPELDTNKQVIDEITLIANQRSTSGMFASEALDTLVKHQLITQERATYVKR